MRARVGARFGGSVSLGGRKTGLDIASASSTATEDRGAMIMTRDHKLILDEIIRLGQELPDPPPDVVVAAVKRARRAISAGLQEEPRPMEQSP